MASELIASLERLTVEEAFRLMYGAYQYLAQLSEEIPSSTRTLLQRLRVDDVDALLHCMKKVLEEQEEVRLVLAGRHLHEGQSHRETLINELQQMIYWACLVAVGRGVDRDSTRLLEFLSMGLAGEEPAKVDIDSGGSERAILRRTLFSAGRAISEFNRANPLNHPLEVRELALWDLRQMAGKDYMVPYLHAAVS